MDRRLHASNDAPPSREGGSMVPRGAPGLPPVEPLGKGICAFGPGGAPGSPHQTPSRATWALLGRPHGAQAPATSLVCHTLWRPPMQCPLDRRQEHHQRRASQCPSPAVHQEGCQELLRGPCRHLTLWVSHLSKVPWVGQNVEDLTYSRRSASRQAAPS
ncbi:hypothetical protein WJX84_005164 [Apatococcus fuscideae]|uniref:Uncharacterized protein n=1 Tax=Apatococcus fuscideae TaxID=2026836 RepID=A0AAW1SVS9_9CHLO